MNLTKLKKKNIKKGSTLLITVLSLFLVTSLIGLCSGYFNYYLKLTTQNRQDIDKKYGTLNRSKLVLEYFLNLSLKSNDSKDKVLNYPASGTELYKIDDTTKEPDIKAKNLINIGIFYSCLEAISLENALYYTYNQAYDLNEEKLYQDQSVVFYFYSDKLDTNGVDIYSPVESDTIVKFDSTFYINYQDPYSLYNVTLTYKASFEGIKTTKEDVTRLTFNKVIEKVTLIDTEIGGRIAHE